MVIGGERNINPEAQENGRIWSYFDAYKQAGQGRAVARPELGSFTHVSEESKNRDIALLERKKSKPDLRERQEGAADAFAFENYLIAQAAEQGWFGGETVPTSEYDDWVSGVDAVLEWADDEGPLRLAVDFTAAEKDRVFFSKSDKLEGNVRVKYLRSAVETVDGKSRELSASMPIVLLGFDKSVFRRVAECGGGPEIRRELGRMLVLQAAAQVDLQIVMTVRRIFEASRAKRTAAGQEAAQAVRESGDDLTAEQAVDLVRGLDAEARDTAFSKKNLSRFLELVRLKEKILDSLRESARSTDADPETQQLFKESKTHQILSA